MLEVDIFYAYIAMCGIPGTIHNPKFPILFSASPDCHMFLRLCHDLIVGMLSQIMTILYVCFLFAFSFSRSCSFVYPFPLAPFFFVLAPRSAKPVTRLCRREIYGWCGWGFYIAIAVYGPGGQSINFSVTGVRIFKVK